MNQVVKFQEPRLPYHAKIEERFGVDRGAWTVLTEAIFPAAKSQDSIVMALSYCRQRKLDVFKRPVHIVPMWSTAKSAMVETVWPGISELRTTAFRTGQHGGMDPTEFGPMETKTFKGTTKGRDPEDIEVSVSYPQWAQCTVYRLYDGKPFRFVGPKVFWLEEFGRHKGIEVPNAMWAKRPHGQLEKCAEAGALRRAFSEEIGNEYTAEEMEGRAIVNEPAVVVQAPSPPPAPPPVITAPLPAATDDRDEITKMIEGERTFDATAAIIDWAARLKAAETRAVQDEIFEVEIEPRRAERLVTSADYNHLIGLLKDAPDEA